MAYTTINDSSAHFQTDLYTGTGSSLSPTFDGNSAMQPDFVWIKERSGIADHALYDSSRGVQKQLESNTTAAGTTDPRDVFCRVATHSRRPAVSP